MSPTFGSKFVLALLLVAAPAFVVLMSIAALLSQGVDLGRLVTLAPQAVAPLGRSALAAFATSLLAGLISLGFATLLVRAWLSGDRAVNLAANAILPVAVIWLLVGAASFAFLWRAPLAEALLSLPFLETRSSATVVVLTTAAHVLRYFPLLLWLLWIATVSISAYQRRYFLQTGFTDVEVVRTHLLGLWIAPTLVVCAFAHQDSFGDQLISYLTLRPSEATDTELLSHFLGRQFRSMAIAGSAQDASAAIVGASIGGAVGSAGVFACSMLVLRALFKVVRLDARTWKPKQKIDRARTRFVAWVPVAVGGVVIAAAITRLATLGPADPAPLASVVPSLVASVVVALLSWVLAVAINFSVREHARLADGSLASRLSWLAIAAMTLGFLPTIGLAVAIYAVAFSFGPLGEVGAYIGWIVSQTLRMFPLVTVLLIPMTLLIDDERVTYMQTVGAGYFARVKGLVLRPFATTHFAILLIASNFVLNEGVVGSVFQAQIASVPELMLRATSGRAAAYPNAVFLSVAQAVIFGVLLLVWGRQTYRQWRSTHDSD